MVTAKILGFSIDQMMGYLTINVEYDIDGERVVNPYRLDFRSMIGKDLKDMTDYIDSNISFQIDRYIEKGFMEKINDEYIKTVLGPLVGKIYSKDSAELNLGDKVIIANQAGTYTEKL